jgi:hypothetical protein
MLCSSFNEICSLVNCNVPNKITIQDLDIFFDIKNAQKCQTTIVYLNRASDGEVIVRQMNSGTPNI